MADAGRWDVGRVGRSLRGLALGATEDDPGVADVLASRSLQTALQRYADEHHVPITDVEAEAKRHLQDMVASHADRATASWARFGAWLMRAHDVLVDEEQMVRLRELDRGHSLALVFSHRSYLDGWVLPHVLATRRFSPTFTFGGANLDLPVVGPLASHTGVIFIKRATKELPVYRLSLRGYVAHLIARRANLAWSIEGGRTRTGKLRPPVHGILRYLADAVEAEPGPDVYVVPIAIVYDQLHEVAGMTAEARGSRKTPEDLTWLVKFARSQRNRLGRAYVSVGEVIPLRDRMSQLRAEGCDTMAAVERVAIDASHRINRATPVTPTGVVCLALLGADRALTFDRVLDTVEPLASYIASRNWPVAGAATLTDRSTIRRSLQELVASGVLSAYEAGTEPVWRIAGDQHLVAAFYRNTVIHILVERAIAEVALLAAADGEESGAGDVQRTAWERSKAIRDLLKFEFFFPGRDEFESELRAELALMDRRAAERVGSITPDEVREVLEGLDLIVAHLVLRPFVDAYLVLADRLDALGDAPVVEEDLLDEALRVGQQWVLQRRIGSAESVSLELFRTALRLARHRGLDGARSVEDGGAAPEGFLRARRAAFRAELEALASDLARLAEYADQVRGRRAAH